MQSLAKVKNILFVLSLIFSFLFWSSISFAEKSYDIKDMSPNGIELLEEMKRLIETERILTNATILSLPVLKLLTFSNPIEELGSLLIGPDDWGAYAELMNTLSQTSGFRGNLCHQLELTYFPPIHLNTTKKYNKTDKVIIQKLYDTTCPK